MGWIEYGLIPKDVNNPNGPKELGVIAVKGINKQYDLPFTQNLESLYKMRPAAEPASVTLIIQKIG